MSYNTAQPPVVLAKGKGLTAPRFWLYATSDTADQVQKKGYFTSGGMVGMRAGDAIMVTDAQCAQPPVMGVVTAVDGGSATVKLAVQATDAGADTPKAKASKTKETTA